MNGRLGQIAVFGVVAALLGAAGFLTVRLLWQASEATMASTCEARGFPTHNAAILTSSALIMDLAEDHPNWTMRAPNPSSIIYQSGPMLMSINFATSQPAPGNWRLLLSITCEAPRSPGPRQTIEDTQRFCQSKFHEESVRNLQKGQGAISFAAEGINESN